MEIPPDDDELLETLTQQMMAYVEINSGQPITKSQARVAAHFLLPSITTEEFKAISAFCRLGEKEQRPRLHKNMAKVLRKLIDEVPVRSNEISNDA